MSELVWRIKEKTDIVDLISEDIKVFEHNEDFKCRCPFHRTVRNDLLISRSKKSWYCTHCKSCGDIFSFIMAYKKMSFADSLEYLANKVGIYISDDLMNKLKGDDDVT